MIKEGIDNAVRNKIIEVYQTSIREEREKIAEAEDWCNCLISDIKNV